MDTALYFPYIRVPRTPWFTQVLLYWDQVASIVPNDLRSDPDMVDRYMVELATAELLTMLDPDDGCGVGSEQFDAGFLSILEGRPVPAAENLVEVHPGKMSRGLFHELVGRGLAQQGNEWEMWWHVEESTADLYMAYLATVISAAHPGTLPVTDSSAAIGTLAGTEGELKQRLAALRYRVITEALPAPRGTVPPAELRSFKEDNEEQLRRCRRFLDGKLADLASIADDDLRDLRSAAVMQEIEDDVARLSEKMNMRRWPGVALLGLGGVVGAALAAAATVASGGTALAVGLGVGAGVIDLGTAGYKAVDLLKEPRFATRAPLAYAALAGRL